ncbi:hypothetical protein ACKFRT_10055 [Corynebacterium sp. YSMAA1_1_F7]|uniref:hypothetical protein n=1 Tax=Corynebacterium sp. YSMAA1_1_F7 TaxID=3383590 RepID=UPI0025F4F7FC|nr:hypothetical protein [uncultured Corynebacterium sp.]
MKLKKSLLALTTAATVAVAGTATAVAEENTPSAGSTATDNNEAGGKTETEPNKDGDKEEPSKLAGSADKFFGWKDDTSGLEKMKSVVTLITTIGALVAGVVTLAANFGKIQNLFK